MKIEIQNSENDKSIKQYLITQELVLSNLQKVLEYFIYDDKSMN